MAVVAMRTAPPQTIPAMTTKVTTAAEFIVLLSDERGNDRGVKVRADSPGCNWPGWAPLPAAVVARTPELVVSKSVTRS
jgi:hypothetical protein